MSMFTFGKLVRIFHEKLKVQLSKEILIYAGIYQIAICIAN